MKPIIFVSCGQVTSQEIQLGKDMVQLIRHDGRYEPYFAENQSSLEGVTANILAKLGDAAAFVAILHPRGEVQVPAGKSNEQTTVTRASVWIEQEIAILAMLVQLRRRSIKVQVYVKRGVVREGLRQYVMTNPHEFDVESDVVQHFREVLAQWDLSSPIRGVALSPMFTRQPDPQDSSLSTLRIALHNAGNEQAVDGRVRIKLPMKYIRHNRIANEKKRNSHLEIELDNKWLTGQDVFQELYPQDTTRTLQEIHFYVDPKSVPPINDVLEIEIRSGNTAAFKGRVPIAGLQRLAPGLPHYVLPEVDGFSETTPFSPYSA